MELIIKDCVTDHLLTQHLINESQHGFLPNKSCMTNLLTFLVTLTETSDEGIPMDIVYLDFSKVFDKVLHQRLSKMEALGISGSVLQWVKPWHTNRKQ